MKSLILNTFPVLTFQGCVFYLAISCVTGLHGQTLKAFSVTENTKIDSIISVFDSKSKLKHLTLLPNINYNFETGFSIGFSLRNLIQYTQTKKRNKIEAMKLKATLESKLETKLNRAEEEKEKILFLKDEIFLNLQVLKHRFELYKISFLKHSNNEITFSEYTEAKISYMEKYQFIFSKIKRLDILLLKYFNKYKVSLFDTDTLLKTTKEYEIANKN